MRIEEVKGWRGISRFVDMAWDLYRGDPNWVPPLRFPLKLGLAGVGNSLFAGDGHAFFLAVNGGRTVGRIAVGIDRSLNRVKERREGFITLFESIDSPETAFALFEAAADWLRARNIETMKGPISPTNGDDYRGLLVEGFDGMPRLMNSYNPPYYQTFFEAYGFVKHTDLYAFDINLPGYDLDLYGQKLHTLMEQFSFRVEPINFRKVGREMADIKRVLDDAFPKDWLDLIPPSGEELQTAGKLLRLVAEKEGILIARAGSRPLGFIIAIPDYNPIIKEIDGRISIISLFKFLSRKNRVKGARVFVLFVVPDFHSKAVASALFFGLITEAKKRGYTYAEGSTVGEENTAAIKSIDAVGARRYRTYRLYTKSLS